MKPPLFPFSGADIYIDHKKKVDLGGFIVADHDGREETNFGNFSSE